MIRLFKIFLLTFTFGFFGCQVEELVEKPPRAHCGKIIKFYDPNFTQLQGNPCGTGYINSEGVLTKPLPGNGSYGLVAVNDITGNEKTFCLNSFAVRYRTSGIGTIFCDSNYTPW